jgi:nitrite reductase/ring-hydroxylating ferredoxin subunit
VAQVKLCRVDAVPAGEPRQFNVAGNEVMVVSLKGRIYCLAARCTHAGAPLAEGKLVEDIIECPWHGSRFRVTDGAVVRGPAERPLAVYRYTIKDNAVFIEI